MTTPHPPKHSSLNPPHASFPSQINVCVVIRQPGIGYGHW